ncbi:hypothetical protein BCR39DRAFT_513611 [Naematelia encephala]|uniref:Uncharacterized protein n=1 Tax=Naematelia encephala TaxID=71784 RepID=A0A1Y2BIK6_9TREE|nr:hypothetical protein BCR39DRAFT_513611 [Naematelia encephala]
MAFLIIAAIKGGVDAHRDFNSPTVPQPKLDKYGQPKRRGPISASTYWLVTEIEKKGKRRNATWKMLSTEQSVSEQSIPPSEHSSIHTDESHMQVEPTSKKGHEEEEVDNDEVISEQDRESWSPHKAHALGYIAPPPQYSKTDPDHASTSSTS